MPRGSDCGSMMVASPTSPLTGTVASANEKGVRLLGHENWFNFSKYAQDLVPPIRGQQVSLTLDRQGFVRGVAPAEGAPRPVAGGSDVQPTSNTRDRTITRLAVLKAAAEFAASRPQLKSGEVLKIATSWERWVSREPEEDLVTLPE